MDRGLAVCVGLGLVFLMVLAGCGSSSKDPSNCAAAQRITGTVTDTVITASARPFTGTAIVVLEQQTSQAPNPVPLYVPVAQVFSDSSGKFSVCASQPGTYLVAAIGFASGGEVYGPTVVPGLSPGTEVEQLPLDTFAFPGEPPSVQPTTIIGQVTTSPNSADVQVGVVDSVRNGSSYFEFVVPQIQQPSAMLALTTKPGGACSAVPCATYTAVVASRAALAPDTISIVNGSGQTVTVPGWSRAATAPIFLIEARPANRSGTAPSCAPPVRVTSSTTSGGFLQAQPGANLTAQTLSFINCP